MLTKQRELNQKPPAAMLGVFLCATPIAACLVLQLLNKELLVRTHLFFAYKVLYYLQIPFQFKRQIWR